MKRFWWFNIVRGVVALIISILIFTWPDSSVKTLVNFMGVYWLASGLMSLRWGFATHKAKGLWIAAGLIGTIGGLGIVLRSLYANYVSPGLALTLLGIIALLTGLIHLFGGFRTEILSRINTWGNVLLGLLEVALGIMLIIATALGPVLKIIAGSWAFVGGVLLILQAIYMRRALKVQTDETQQSVV